MTQAIADEDRISAKNAANVYFTEAIAGKQGKSSLKSFLKLRKILDA